MEFGLCVENDELKIYGAGLLSSAAELKHVINGIRAGEICLQKFNVEDVVSTECVVTSYQKRYFYNTSIEEAKLELRYVCWKNLFFLENIIPGKIIETNQDEKSPCSTYLLNNIFKNLCYILTDSECLLCSREKEFSLNLHYATFIKTLSIRMII